MSKSPMMEHYLQIKQQYSDCIVFYRLGDFYEMFFEDAKVVSSALELTLTGRDCGGGERAPMCGVPFHAADVYISKLVSLGFKVAICEQLTEPIAGKKLVERDVIRVITSGTLTGDGQIDEKKNNFICSVYGEKGFFGISWADITTGDFTACELKGEEKLFDLITRIMPSEIIVNQEIYSDIKENPLFIHNVVVKPNAYKEYAYAYSTAEKSLLVQFDVHSLNGFEIKDKTHAICSAGALVEYLRETQKHALANVNSIAFERDGEYMVIDGTCARNLEITSSMRDGKTYGSLLYVLDKTVTAMGARYMRTVLQSPLQNSERINYRLDGVEELNKNFLVTNSLREALSGVKDIERISGRLSNGVITPRDMETLWKSLEIMPEVKLRLSGLSSAVLNDTNANIDDLSEITTLLKRAIKDNPPVSAKEGGFVREGFDEELDRLNNIRENGRKFLLDLEAREREKTGIKNLKVAYNKVFGYYIEVTNSFKDKVPYEYVRKQTLTGAERFITEELKQFEEEILTSSERAIKKESEIFEKLKTLLTGKLVQLKKISKAVSVLDVLLSFAYVAKRQNYCRPEIAPMGEKMDIVGGRHPVVESIAGQFIANDTYLDCDENSMMIITGPNMAGKSTYMRQVALITIMAHCGCFVPAKSAIIPITDRVFTRVGASDNLILDQSTFMVEMSEVALILRSATKNSLIVFDEVGRGTSTYDGLSIAWAVVEYVCNKLHAKTLFATHYHELSELEGVLDGVKNYKITVKEVNGSIMFLRRIMRGSANKSFGIEVASLAGVPQEVTKRAKSILKKLEKNDLARQTGEITALEEEVYQLSETESAIKSLDLDNLTPMQALQILSDLKRNLN